MRQRQRKRRWGGLCLYLCLSSLRLPQDRHARDGARAADVVHQTELGIFDLARTALPAQLRDDLVDHAYAAGADGMAEGLEPAARIYWNIAGERRAPLFDELGPLALLGEAEILIVSDLGPGEAVVHLGDIDLFQRVPDAGHLISLGRGVLGRTEPEVIKGGVHERPPAGDRQPHAFHQDVVSAVLLRQV